MRILIVTLLLSVVPLVAPLQAACDSPEARQFDFWIGSWDVVNKRLDENGDWVFMGRAVDEVYPVVGGCGIVEHWRGTAWGQQLIGFSVRSFDAASGQWQLLLSWPQPEKPGFGQLAGVFTHGRGEFFSRSERDGKPQITRYTFSDATPSSMRWDAARSFDEGQTWKTHWIMEMTRRPEGALPLFNGPWIANLEPRRCPGEAEALDTLLGTWKGRRGEDSVHVDLLPILDGCAVLELTRIETPAGETTWESYGILAHESEAGHWITHRLTPEAGLHALQAEPGDPFRFASDGRSLRYARDGNRLEITRGGSEGEPETWELTRTYFGDREPVVEVGAE